MSENTSTARKTLNQIIDKLTANDAMSKNDACKLIGEAMGKLARRGRPYHYRYVSQMSNGKPIADKLVPLINRVGGYIFKSKRARHVRQIVWPTAEGLELANTLTMAECRLAIKSAAIMKRQYGRI